MNEDTRRIEINPDGIFVVGVQKLGLSALKRRKTRLEGRILDLQQEQRHFQTQMKNNAREITELEFELATFNNPKVLEWIARREKEIALERERAKKEKLLANQRAKTFLREYVGEIVYTKLMKKGSLEFVGKDGREYKITSKGVLFRGSSRLCVIHPRNLPLPDFILSVLTTVKERGYRR